MVIEKHSNKCFVIDIENPSDHNLVKKKVEKLEKYADLRVEVARMWSKETVVIPIIIGALGSIRKDLHTVMSKLEIKYELDTLQHSATGNSKYFEESVSNVRGIYKRALSVGS